MSIELELTGTLEKESERELFSGILKSICEEMKVKMEDYDTYVMIDVCPEGAIECCYEKCFISITAQTSNVGPGFHAFVCTLFDEILKDGTVSFEVSDPTNYYFDRNFENLKYKHFFTWLKSIAIYVKESTIEDLYLSWPKGYYLPLTKKGFVVTPMGYIKINDFKSLEIEELAEKFFIWNDVKRNAKYYRNCAMTLLWKECYYEYSTMNDDTDKIAETILDYLEAAYECDDTIALPMQIYQDLCTSLQREILIHDAQDMELSEIGYRRGSVLHQFKNWTIPAHGCCELSYDRTTQTKHFMAPYKNQDDPWKWMIKANAYTYEKEEPTFINSLQDPQDDNHYFTIKNEDCEIRGTVVNQEEYYSMIVQVNSGMDTLFLECIIRNETDIEMIKNWCAEIRYHPSVSNQVIN